MNRIFLTLSFLCLAYVTSAQIQGPTPTYLGTTQNYTFSNGIIYTEWYWTATGGKVVSSSLVGTQYQVSVKWDSVSTTNKVSLWRTTYFHGEPLTSTVSAKTIDVQVPTPTATITQAQNCGNTVVTRTNNPPSSLYEWWWQTDPAGTSTDLGKSTSDTIKTPQNLYLRARTTNTPYVWSTALQSLGTISVTGAPAIPFGIVDEVINGMGSTTIQVVPQGGDSVRWYSELSGTSPAFFKGTSSYTTPVLTQSVTYYITTYNSATHCESKTRTPITVKVASFVIPSQIETAQMRVSGITKDVDTYALNNVQRKKQVTYFDGLSRTFQQIDVAASPNGYDVVQPVEFNDQARVSKNILPYVASSNDGTFKTDFMVKQPQFYLATNDKIANDAKPYDSAVFEDSPLARIKEAGALGAATWKDGATTVHRTKRFQYTFNTAADNVRKFTNSGSSTVYYDVNKLVKVVLTDENDNLTITFSDDLGRTVLKRAQLDETINGAMVNWLDTYYIYDDFGRLKYTISPKGTKALQDNGWNFSGIIDQYVFVNVYDARGRLVEKKTPGQASMYYGYDDLNRLVLTQDGLLRNSNQWMFIKYDQKGRAVMQGLYTDAVNTTRSAMQIVLDGLYTAANPTYGVNAWYETRSNVLENYTNNSFPKTNQNGSAVQVLSVNYYDNYNFDNSTEIDPEDFRYEPQNLTGSSPQQTTVTEAAQGNSYGLATGSKKLILGTSTWLYTYVFYDKYGRTIQVRKDNHLLQTKEDLSTNLYDFEGKLVVSKTFHKTGSTADNQVKVINRYKYDTQGRLVKLYQNTNPVLDSAKGQLIAKYEYNELGQLVDKKLHGSGTGGSENTFLQSVDFRYNIRGQLASINNAKLTNDGYTSNDDDNDFFGMELLYNTVESGLNNTPSHNGNISAIKWKGIGATSGDANQKSYKYTYDKSNKLKAADYQMKGTSIWDKEMKGLNENIKYDHNGNILRLTRKQNQHELQIIGGKPTVTLTTITIDSLIYNYTSGNRLSQVSDVSVSPAGFTDGVTKTTEYTYDTLGNLTADANKGIDSIKYNVLGKACRIKFHDGRLVVYTYDASGVKLKTAITTVNGKTTTTDYVNGFVYNTTNGTRLLSFFSSPEGRAVKNSIGNFEYQYAIADHQGNTRVVFTSVAPTPQATIATFEGDGNDQSSQFQNVTPITNGPMPGGGTKVIKMNQTTPVGPALSKVVSPGDKIKLSVDSYYEAGSGYGGTNTPLSGIITQVAGALVAGTGGVDAGGLKTSGVNNAFTNFGAGPNQGDTHPAAYLNYILFDLNYKVMDAGWQVIQPVSFTKQHDTIPTIRVKEAGFIFTYLSYENQSSNYVYFDNFNVTIIPTNIVIQSNEYYPFGLQTANSWTRDNSTNNFLYNEGSELNGNTQWYEMFYRGYDPALGRMLQVDPYAGSFTSISPYNYALNNPAVVNDPSGGFAYSPSSAWGPRATQNWLHDLPRRNGYGDWALDRINNYGNGATESGGGGGSGNNRAFLNELYAQSAEGETHFSAAAVDFLWDVWNDPYASGFALSYNSDGTIDAQVSYLTAGLSSSGIKSVRLDGAYYLTQDDFPGGKLFSNVEEGLNTLWSASFKNGRAYKENSGYFTPEGLLINSNEGNGTHSSDPGVTFAKDGKMFVYFGSSQLEVLGMIHTHPNAGDIQEPSSGVDFQGCYLGLHSYVMGKYDLFDAYYVNGRETVDRLGNRTSYSQLPSNFFPLPGGCW